MELYILSISGEQICDAKHWIQDETHGYMEAITTKLIKQDPGLSTADRILNRNKDTLERKTNHASSHTPAQSILPLQKNQTILLKTHQGQKHPHPSHSISGPHTGKPRVLELPAL